MYALIAVALASNLARLADSAAAYSSPNRSAFDIVAYESRFAGVRRDLPANGPVGYLSDSDPNLTSSTAEYYLTQFALIPRVVASDANRTWVVGNIHTQQPPAFWTAHGLHVVKDYGNGVLLLRRPAK